MRRARATALRRARAPPRKRGGRVRGAVDVARAPLDVRDAGGGIRARSERPVRDGGALQGVAAERRTPAAEQRSRSRALLGPCECAAAATGFAAAATAAAVGKRVDAGDAVAGEKAADGDSAVADGAARRFGGARQRVGEERSHFRRRLAAVWRRSVFRFLHER